MIFSIEIYQLFADSFGKLKRSKIHNFTLKKFHIVLKKSLTMYTKKQPLYSAQSKLLLRNPVTTSFKELNSSIDQSKILQHSTGKDMD